MIHLTRRHAAIGTLTFVFSVLAIVVGVATPSQPVQAQPNLAAAAEPTAGLVRVRAAGAGVRRQRRPADRSLPVRRPALRRCDRRRRRDAAVRPLTAQCRRRAAQNDSTATTPSAASSNASSR